MVRFDGYRIRHFKYHPDKPTGIGGNYIGALYQAKDGRLWIGTESDGVSVYDAKTEQFEHFRHQPNQLSHSLSQSLSRSLSRSLSHNRISAIVGDTMGNIWIGTNQGLDLFEPNKQSFTHYTHQPSSSEIWLGTYSRGISVVDAQSGQLLRQFRHDNSRSNSLNFDHVSSLIVDTAKQIWIGTWGGGINRFASQNAYFHTLINNTGRPNTLSHPHVLSILVLDNDLIWIGTHGNCIDIVYPAIGVIGGFRPNPDDPNALGDGSIKMAQSEDGTLWVSTTQADLYRYVPASSNFIRYTDKQGLGANYIWSILPTPDCRLWVSTTQADLYRYVPASSNFIRYTDKQGLGANYIWSILPTPDCRLWVAQNKIPHSHEVGVGYFIKLKRKS